MITLHESMGLCRGRGEGGHTQYKGGVDDGKRTQYKGLGMGGALNIRGGGLM